MNSKGMPGDDLVLRSVPLLPGVDGVILTAVKPTEHGGVEKALELRTQELIEANQALWNTQSLYRSALAAGRLGTWETDLLAKTRLWTPEGMALFGIDIPGGRGHVGGDQDEYWSALHPDDRHLMQEFHELADSQDTFGSEYRVVRPDGTTLWLRGHGTVVARTPAGKAHRLVSIVADITERRLAEQALLESEERLRIASESAQIGIWDYDLTTDTLRWDDRTRALFGLSYDAPVSYDVFLAGLHPEDRDAIHAANQRALDPTGGGEYDIEYRTVGLDDGITRWIAAKGKCYFENGRAVRYIGTVLDIGRAKRSEELQRLLLREMNHRLNNLFAVVSGMTALSARSARTPQEMSRSLRGRLDALSRANNLVRPGFSGSEPSMGKRTTMAELVRTVLLPYSDNEDSHDRYTASGPDVPVGAKSVTSLLWSCTKAQQTPSSTVHWRDQAARSASNGAPVAMISGYGGRRPADQRLRTLHRRGDLGARSPNAALPISLGVPSHTNGDQSVSS